jgi:CRISPR-associated protein Csm2
MELEIGTPYKGRKIKECNLKEEWISKGLHTDAKSTEWAKGFAYHLAVRNETNDKISSQRPGKIQYRANLSTSQLRKFFGEMKRIQAQEFDNEGRWKAEFQMLKPKLAYAVGRERSADPKIVDFYHELSSGIDAVETKEQFHTFVQLVEAIVAYHKYFEKTAKSEDYEQD